MATTTLLQRHAGEGETIAEAIRDCLDYGKDPEKTESGKYISAYECDPATVADEFLLAKASYAAAGYRLPDLVFWNVDSRNGQQPVRENDRGVALVSGCSPRIFSMVMDGRLNPYEFMLRVIDTERYAPIAA